MISFTLILVWASASSLAGFSVPVFMIGSLILASGFVYENRRLLRPAAPVAEGAERADRTDAAGRLLARYGAVAAAIFLGMVALTSEMVPYAFFHFFHPK